MFLLRDLAHTLSSERVCTIGCQPGFLNSAAMQIGTNVSMKIGNVNAYSTFFAALHRMFFHSVTVVITPITNSVE